MEFAPYWNLASVPDAALKAEWARRNSARRAVFAGGRPSANRLCPFCSAFFSASDLRSHSAGCRQNQLSALKGAIVIIVPTLYDLNENGFVIRSVSRELIRLEKCGYWDSAALPATAVRSIVPAHDGLHAVLTLAGNLAFSKPEKRWVFTPFTEPGVSGEKLSLSVPLHR